MSLQNSLDGLTEELRRRRREAQESIDSCCDTSDDLHGFYGVDSDDIVSYDFNHHANDQYEPPHSDDFCDDVSSD
ncbi:hypothetical protein [Thioflexithrix psekupsensis]|uniref:Uncharacterized protein n=1 Tax=Thioflexithrix psekupsensis TaxID=1570016 RepID=A0A251X9Z3_9GAMM|nr:hypothetical protein [Thioflexithrix psekupsensis]OUD15252.1 hypothetical protein TPSD3_01600 [Thioflexithrix psekupsensis]